MRIAVIGTGYVGLVAGTCFSESGNTVVCVDVDGDKIARLNRGETPIYEPGLKEMVAKNTEEARLTFTTDVDRAVKESLVIFIAVGTPPGEDGSADLHHVLAAASSVGKAMNGYKIIVDKSTVPVGTARKVAAAIAAETTHPFNVVSNPEFLKEGAAIDDFMKPDRVVIGTDDPRVTEIMKELYAPFVRTGNPILVMDVASAELTKYAANAMLATRISFMNEIANICERVGADVTNVREGIGTDSRIGMPFLFPGCGYGGSCFPKDSRAIISTGRDVGYRFQIMEAVEDVNAAQKRMLFRKAEQFFNGDLNRKIFAVWGLAFKAKTDDIRDASALVLIDQLLASGAAVNVSDPEAIDTTRRVLGSKVKYFAHAYEALEGASALFVATEWNEFRNPDFEKMKTLMKTPVIFDGRNLYNPVTLGELGFKYFRIGAPGTP